MSRVGVLEWSVRVCRIGNLLEASLQMQGGGVEVKLLARSSSVREVRDTRSYQRMRSDDEEESGNRSMRSESPVRASLKWLHRALAGPAAAFAASSSQVPLSESPKRELRMKSAAKARSSSGHSIKKHQEKHFSSRWC